MTMRAKHLLNVTLALSASLGLVFLLQAVETPGKQPEARTNFNPRYTPVVDLVKRVKGAVVNIHSERSVRATSGEDFFALSPSQNRINGMGTGILIDPRGYIVTNHHVVEDVNSIRVRLVDGTVTAARVVARDAESDLALLKIDLNRELPVMPLGTASDLMVGETVVAIGNAYGYDHTVSVGVVSAINRDVTLNKEISYKSLIQTDAAINPGNSGGPLLNIRGELIGVNVAIRAGAQNIGFAITVDNMMRVAADLISSSRRGGTSLGLVTRDRVTAHETQAPERELLVESTNPDSVASHAGLRRGDVIIRVGGQQVASRLDLERSLTERPAGEVVTLEVLRNGKTEQVKLALAGSERPNPANAEMAWRKLGLKLTKVEAELVSRSNKSLHGGLLVDEVRVDSPAAKAGIQQGDILVGLHQWEMITLENLAFVLVHPDLSTFMPLRFYIVRASQVHRGWIQNLDE
jgi:serine protease Do